MKAISIHPNYVLDILNGTKTKESRTWTTNYRGDLLICSTAKKIPHTISGHALCVVTLSAISQLPDQTYAWELSKLRLIKPFPVKGKQRLYTVSDDQITYPKESNIWEHYYTPLIQNSKKADR